MYPIATGTALGFGVDPLPFVFALAVAASASFATLIGYQANLMVYGPGGYRFGDYLRVGVPMNVAVGATACVVTPLMFASEWGWCGSAGFALQVVCRARV